MLPTCTGPPPGGGDGEFVCSMLLLLLVITFGLFGSIGQTFDSLGLSVNPNEVVMLLSDNLVARSNFEYAYF